MFLYFNTQQENLRKLKYLGASLYQTAPTPSWQKHYLESFYLRLMIHTTRGDDRA